MNLNLISLRELFKNYFFKKKKKIPLSYLKYFRHDEKTTCVETHKNNVQLFYLHKSKIFRKYSNTVNGIKKIKSEEEGLDWYCKRAGIKKKNVIKKYFKGRNIAFLDIKKIEGKKIKSVEILVKLED